jgi:hypothetical protein
MSSRLTYIILGAGMLLLAACEKEEEQTYPTFLTCAKKQYFGNK